MRAVVENAPGELKTSSKVLASLIFAVFADTESRVHEEPI